MKTIPIYWGCPNISKWFDTTGWIVLEFGRVTELRDKLAALTPTWWDEHRSVVERNYIAAKKYADLYTNLNAAMTEDCA